jgi:cytochrome c oxidase assembly protein subunit 15
MPPFSNLAMPFGLRQWKDAEAMNAEPHMHYVAALAARERAHRARVRIWLYVVAVFVFAMVLVGGATRLTDSGLSITEWNVVSGAVPPLSDADWQAEFDKYRQTPEFRRVNKDMTLSGFKVIYWWEWAHRFLGRIAGFVFAVPLALFWWMGWLERGLKPRLLALLALGGLQGAVGWWMVASGLVDRVDVSQYRLAAHLGLAAILFAAILWVARSIAPHSTGETAGSGNRILSPLLLLLVLAQIMLGALVAGLDAGLAFNDWPLMDGAIVPGDLLIQQPAWTNFFENPKTVQFTHRMAGYGLLLVALVLWLAAKAESPQSRHRRRATVLLALVLVQATLGVATLVMQAPFHLSLAHQAGAFVVLGFVVAHWRAVIGPWSPVTSIEARV